MTPRPPAPPPALPGYEVVRFLGSGGFSDVHVYRQRRPQRLVAVKVLRPEAVNPVALQRFETEADLMATLSTHPAIVTIHEAELSADGRPYIVMEYCSRPTLSARYRAERLSVAEVLRIGVQLAGAVETCHRAGILHRDIKPSNVLTTDFGRPVLSDFGISVQRSAVLPGEEGAVGLSIPWSPPEIFDTRVPADERADTYSLAATLYTVLASRSPFDRPGGPNSSADLIARIRSSPLPALGRGDVPASLERVLARAMDRTPGARYATALDLARALQQVEIELRLTPTEVDVRDDHPSATTDGGDGDQPATRVRALTVIDAQPDHAVPPESVRPPPPASATPGGQHWGPPQPPGPVGVDEDTRRRSPDPAPLPPPPRRRRWVLPAVLAAVVVVAAAAVVWAVGRGGTDPAPAPRPPDSVGVASSGDAVVAGPDAVVDLRGEVQGGAAVFRWRAPGRRDGDVFQWTRTDPGAGAATGRVATVAEPAVRIPGGDASTCIAVRVVDADGRASDRVTACVGD